MRRFYLGAPDARFLVRPELADVPLTVSRRTLGKRRTQPARPQGGWSLDSGAFTELSLYGKWTVGAGEYVDQVRRIVAGVGSAPDWVGPRDWMCEPVILAQTGLTVWDHHDRTCADYVDLVERAPEVPWLPVLQGWAPGDYERHVRLYECWGVRLVDAPLVGVGTVCRRQATTEVAGVLAQLAGGGLRLHGFGVKVSGLARPGVLATLASADSMAWSFAARRAGHRNGANGCGSPAHRNCANCPVYAAAWYRETVARWGLAVGTNYVIQ